MKFLFLCLAAACLALTVSGCGEVEKSSRPASLAVAGVPPVAYLAERIAGVPVRSALPDGRSPHDFSPQPGDVRAASGARFFFVTGMPFEELMVKAVRQSPVKVVDVTRNITRIPLEGGECGHEDHGHSHGHHAHEKEAMDPHVWLSPANCRHIAQAILQVLSEAVPEKRAVYEANFKKLSAELEAAEKAMAETLAPFKGRTFFVHHPAFGYFAAGAGLKQRSIELGGREPSPAQLAEVIREARAHKVRTIFVQMQFNPASANALAKAIGGTAVELDLLRRDVLSNFRDVTAALVTGFNGK